MNEQIIKHRWLIYSVAVLLAGILFLILGIIPLAKAAVKTWQSNGIKRERLDLAQLKQEQKDRIEADFYKMTGIHALLQAGVAGQDEMSEVIGKINRAATDAKVELVSFYPKDETSYPGYKAVPLELYLKGTYHGIGRFVNRLERMEYITGVDRLALQAPNMLDEVLKASVKLTVYLGKDETRQKQSVSHGDAETQRGEDG